MSMQAREGPLSELATNERVNFTPSCATRSRLGGLDVAVIIGREHLRCVVVGHDIDDVVALLCGGTEGKQRGNDGKKLFLHDIIRKN